MIIANSRWISVLPKWKAQLIDWSNDRRYPQTCVKLEFTDERRHIVCQHCKLCTATTYTYTDIYICICICICMYLSIIYIYVWGGGGVCLICGRTFRCTTANQCSSEQTWIDNGPECSNRYSSGGHCLRLLVIVIYR